MAATTPSKDTVYIDVDDEITGIIDKLRSSDGKIVALVLPKRASVFQSIVNMKLLKRAADEDKKHLVLITSEVGLLPLAGLAGVLVASSLTSKPTVPMAPMANDDQEETVDEATGETTDFDSAAAGAVAVGELAGMSKPTDDVETIEMDDEAEAPEVAAAAVATQKVKKVKKDKKLLVPNFERFRWLLIGGVALLILLIGGIGYAMTALPRATIAITTDATNINTTSNFTADSAANTYNAGTHTLPAKQVQQQKVYSQAIATTGQKNNGDKATGQVQINNCGQDDITLPAGTGVSSNGFTFITQNSVDVPVSGFYTKKGITTCQNDGHNTVNVKAQAGGSGYNLADQSKYTVSGQGSGVTGVGTAMSGGTDNITKIVNQSDIDSATAKIVITDATIKSALQAQLTQSGSFALVTTFNIGEPAITTSAKVGDAADNVTVTDTINYTMLGVQQNDIKSLVDENIKKQIDTSKQSILDEGLRGATFTANNANGTSAQLTVQTVAVAGPDLKVATIKTAAVGKKAGEVKTELSSNPGVTNVVVKLSPFFVTSVPKKLDRITVTIAKPKVNVTPKSNGSTP
jgi:hypothetical protein